MTKHAAETLGQAQAVLTVGLRKAMALTVGEAAYIVGARVVRIDANAWVNTDTGEGYTSATALVADAYEVAAL